MSSTIYIILFIVVVSTLFPLGGYYLDWKHNRKMRTGHPSKKNSENP
jgi:hypothetical protein